MKFLKDKSIIQKNQVLSYALVAGLGMGLFLLLMFAAAIVLIETSLIALGIVLLVLGITELVFYIIYLRVNAKDYLTVFTKNKTKCF